MTPPSHLTSSTGSRVRIWRDERAAQLVEFAVALPLLVLFVVGIFDFSAAFTLKQKLTNIARDAARSAAADPSTDLSGPSTTLPASVSDAYQLIQNYLQANNIDNCNLALSSPGNSQGPGLLWTFSVTPSSGSPCGITIIINRVYIFPANSAQTASVNCRSAGASANQIQIVATCVSIQYAYQWRFGKAASILGSNTVLPTNIPAASVAINEN